MIENVWKQDVALIGAGNWGKNHARNFAVLGALHTICDSSEALLDTFQKQYPNVHMTTNTRSVFTNPDIKKVVIAAPAMAHYTLAKDALLAGKDVFVEKPLCLESREGEELNHLAKKHGRILMVGHLLQYHPYVRKLQELIGWGELGKLQYIVSNRLNLGSIRTEENALWNFAPHDISVILSICGHQLPEEVRCTGAVPLANGVADTTLTTLRFAQDLHAHIYVSWLNPFKEQKLTVVGSHGMAVFDDTLPWQEKLVLYRNHIVWAKGNVPTARKPEPEKVEIPQEEPLSKECIHFLECCEKRVVPRTDGEEGLRVLQVLQAAQVSLNKNGEATDPRIEHQRSLNVHDYFSHPTAVIHRTAMIGKGTKIWHFSHLMEKSTVGERCNIGQNVVVSPGVVLGKNVKVQNNVSIYTGVVCEDDVFLGPSMVFTNITNPRSSVSRKDQYQQTLVRRGATIGANATIVCGATLGEYCFVGAGAVVTKDIPAYALVVGNPARQVGWMSRHGEKLELPLSVEKGDSQRAACPATGEQYELTHEGLEYLGAYVEGLCVLSQS